MDFRDSIDNAIVEVEARGLEPGSNERIGFVFGYALFEHFGEREGQALWLRITGLSIEQIEETANDIQKHQFKTAFGMTLHEACELIKKTQSQLRVVK